MNASDEPQRIFVLNSRGELRCRAMLENEENMEIKMICTVNLLVSNNV